MARQSRPICRPTATAIPLSSAALAGLVNDYLPAPGDFDKWVADPAYGGSLNLADLDLTQKRNHILRTAIDALSPPSLQLLQTLALLHGGADYAALKAFNPHMPPPPKEVEEPSDPETLPWWEGEEDLQRAAMKAAYVRGPSGLGGLSEGAQHLEGIVRHQQSYGRAQRDRQGPHRSRPAAIRSRPADATTCTRWSVALSPAVSAERRQPRSARRSSTILRPGRILPGSRPRRWLTSNPGCRFVRTLLRMGRFEEALHAYQGGLSIALLFNLNANNENLALLKPFFPAGWGG